MDILANFHFLYPLWFLLLPLLSLFLWWINQVQAGNSSWDNFIDEKLRPYVLSANATEKNKYFLLSLAVAGLISIFSLAGPSWDKSEVPAFQTQQGLVVGMDLSTSMIANDITPSRLVRSRFKLIDLLKLRKEGQTGLVVFAGAAFAVSPLTDDVKNISEQIKHLGPGTMPSQGSLLYSAIDEATKLLQQSDFKKGNILLMTDGLSNLSKAISSAKKAREQGYRVSILGVGTKKGTTIPLAGGRVLRDRQGNPVITSLNESELRQVATAGGGDYRFSSLGDDDIKYFTEQFSAKKSDKLNQTLLKNKNKQVEYWNNAGIWLSLLLLPFVLLLFRRGVLFSVLLAFFLLPQTKTANAFEWDALWQNNNQRGKVALENKQADKAAALFNRPDWQATAAYRQGDYQKAIDLFSQFDSADADYNRGNALAKQQKMDEAIKAYQQALKKNPELQDAKDNLALLKKLKQKKQQDKKNGKEREDNKQDNSDQKKNKKNQDKNKNKKKGQKNKANQQNKNDKTSEEKSKEEQQKKEAEKLKQQAEKNKKDDGEGISDPNDHGRLGKESEIQKKPKKEMSKEERQKKQEKDQRAEQWLRKIPDDSAGLWRRKFMYQYRDRNQSVGEQPW